MVAVKSIVAMGQRQKIYRRMRLQSTDAEDFVGDSEIVLDVI